MDITYHIVDYESYCRNCKFYNVTETEEPCQECLNNPVAEYSRKPIMYKENK